jgi:hypothetical protein
VEPWKTYFSFDATHRISVAATWLSTLQLEFITILDSILPKQMDGVFNGEKPGRGVLRECWRIFRETGRVCLTFRATRQRPVRNAARWGMGRKNGAATASTAGIPATGENRFHDP